MPQDVVRYGLLSTAQIGLNAHLPASYDSKNSEIVSISSRTADKAEAAAKNMASTGGTDRMKNNWLIQESMR